MDRLVEDTNGSDFVKEQRYDIVKQLLGELDHLRRAAAVQETEINYIPQGNETPEPRSHRATRRKIVIRHLHCSLLQGR